MSADVRTGLLGGVLATTVMLTTSLSYAALVFSGGLSTGLRFGMTDALLATAFISATLGLFGSMRFPVGGPPGNALAVVAVIAAEIERTISAEGRPEALMPTVLVAIGLTTVSSGAFLFLLGALRAGRWMRFIPYPVVGGVLGAAGWLIVLGSLRVMGGGSRLELGVGLAFAILLVLATMRIRHPLVLPSLLVAGTGTFYAALLAGRVSVANARSLGWLFNVPHGSPFAIPWLPATLGAVAWPAIGQSAANIAAVLLVMALSVLFNTSGIELTTEREADLDHELRTQGAANVASGLFGGFVCVGLPNVTLLTYRYAGTSRIPPLVVAGASVLLLLGGAALVDAVPRFVFGALIFNTGFMFLYEWCVRTARRLPLYDYLSILAIVAVVVRFGYVAGVVAGILIGCIIFVVTYSQVRVVKHSLSGAEYRSVVMRSSEERAVLREHGEAIRILVLQGFIFFGLAERLQRGIRALLETSGRRPKFVVLDFRAVSGLDSSAASSFAKMRQVAGRRDAILVFTGMTPEMERQWKLSTGKDARGVVQFPEIDAALEYCEGQILAEYAGDRSDETTLEDWLGSELGDEHLVERLVRFLETRALEHGELLCEQGSPADAMFFIERGRVGVSVRTENGSVRLRSLGDRTILGEMGLYRSSERSASVIAEKPSVVHVLRREAFRELEREDPVLAATFHAAIVRTLADRLEFESAMVASLQR